MTYVSRDCGQQQSNVQPTTNTHVLRNHTTEDQEPELKFTLWLHHSHTSPTEKGASESLATKLILSTMAIYIITGCSRGLGLALTAELAKVPGNMVFATSRGNPTPALSEVITASQGQVKHVKLDIASSSSIEEAETKIAAMLDGKGVDVLINNAGVINWMTDGIHAM
jgi:hypothetical protein